MSLIDALLLDAQRIDVWLALRTDGNRGCGTQSDPYNASTAELFDGVLMSLGPMMRIHLGPGEFLTHGFRVGATMPGWQLKKGWKIVGAGIDVTKVILTGTDTNDAHYYAMSHDFAHEDPNIALADYCEISDLTIDCNLAEAGSATPASGAVRLKGNHTRIRRVKVIGWGTKSSSTPCVVIASITSDPDSAIAQTTIDAGIEECIAVEPYADSADQVTALYSGVVADYQGAHETFGNAPFIRRCFVDPGTDLEDEDIVGLVMNSCNSGTVESNEIENIRTGGPFLDGAASIRSIAVRGNVYKNVAYGVLWNLGQTSDTLTGIGFTAGTNEVTFTLATEVFAVGDRIEVAGAGGFNGVFQLTEVEQVSGPSFKYTYVKPSVSGSATGTVAKIYGIDKAVVEGNSLELRKETAGSSEFPIVGIQVLDMGFTGVRPPYAHREVQVFGNQVRLLNGMLGEGFTALAIVLHGVETIHVQNNFVSVDEDNPIRQEDCGERFYSSNRQLNGRLIRGYDTGTNRKQDELETLAEDAFLLALLK